MIELDFSDENYAKQKKLLGYGKLLTGLFFGSLGLSLLGMLMYAIFTAEDFSQVSTVKIPFILAMIPGILIGVLVIPIFILSWKREIFETKFWKQFASKNNGHYYISGSIHNKAYMLRYGEEQEINDIVTIEKNNNSLTIFTFSFLDGILSKKTRFYFTVFSIPYKGITPHIFLNYKHHGFEEMPGRGRGLSVPKEFSNNFSVHTPEKYEIEALEIFTPDILEIIVDSHLKIDVEIIDGAVMFFIPKPAAIIDGFNTYAEKLEKKYKVITLIMQKLIPKLDRFNFTKIGDKPVRL